MNNEQKLESAITQYRQMLADEQLKVVQLNILVEEQRQRIQELERELEESRVSEKTETKDAK